MMTDTKRNIRNFSIIAHIDHGKSTLADRMLELTGTIEKRKMKDRVLDTLELEQEKGITIKLQTVRMKYKGYILNLIDTPGHVDFSYEVSRSLAACEGAVLLVDATQGVQAQTISTIYQALENNLEIIPVVNKVDLEEAEIDKCKQEMAEMFGFKEEEIVLTSGKTGEGVEELLEAIVERVPAPATDSLNSKDRVDGRNRDDDRAELDGNDRIDRVDPPAKAKWRAGRLDHLTKALIFDSFYHEHKGVVALVKVVSGEIRQGDEVYFFANKTAVEPLELGYLTPNLTPDKSLETGEVGYVATGLKDIKKVRVGDTVMLKDEYSPSVKPLPGYKPAKSMVFAGLYPTESDDFREFKEALEKLALNDAALSYKQENSKALGFGYRCGFLGLLHMEITQERLEREFGVDLIITAPSVEYRIKTQNLKLKTQNRLKQDEEGDLVVESPAEYPDPSVVEETLEPWVKLEIFTPDAYIGPIMKLCQERRGIYKATDYLTSGKGVKGIKHVSVKYEIPTAEIISDFFDQLKSVSRGYASMDYEFLEYRPADVVKVDIIVQHEKVDALAMLVPRDYAEQRGREIVKKLKEVLPKQQFVIPIQAAIGGKIIARENKPALRKDVTAKLYGGDVTRKRKLLEKQKKGKKRLKMFGSVEIPQEAFLAVLRREE